MEDRKNWARQTRRDLHQIPEIGFDLFETSNYLYQALTDMGYRPISIAKTGWIVVLEGEMDEAVAFRADMDGLPVTEQTNTDYTSRHEGKMHACGHDGHMTMLLGLAKELIGKKLKKRVVLIFQPAEEAPGGARIIVESGIFAQYKITSIFGIHLYPGLTSGKFGVIDGEMLAQNAEFDVFIQGKSAHGAQPHLGNDAIVAASALVGAYHTIVSRDIDPLLTAVVTVGTIFGGEARNIIPKQVQLSGTIRSFKENVDQTIKQRMKQIEEGISIAYNVKISSEVRDYYPPVINDSSLYRLVSEMLMPDETEPLLPLMFAEDFAFYQRATRGMFVMLGTQDQKQGYIHPLHSCYFDFDEDVLLKGIDYYLRIALASGVLDAGEITYGHR